MDFGVERAVLCARASAEHELRIRNRHGNGKRGVHEALRDDASSTVTRTAVQSSIPVEEAVHSRMMNVGIEVAIARVAMHQDL